MNKKIIAIAIAAAMSAPVMADVKVAGVLGGSLTINNDKNNAFNAEDGKASRTFNDDGRSMINFVVTEGNSFAKLGLNVGGATAGTGGTKARDFFVGHKLGGGMAISFGNMNGALKNIEKDPYIATFLQLRKTDGIAATAPNYGSTSFVKNVIQLTMKAGSANIKVQLDPTTNFAGSTNEGHIGIAVTGKAGSIGYFAGYNNGIGADKGPANITDALSQSNIKLGASMKFGKIKATAMLSTSDDGAATDSNAQSISIMANMGMGNGLSANVAYGMKNHDIDAQDGVWLRLAVAKKLSKKSTIFAGYTSSKKKDADTTSQLGAGMTIKF